MSCYFFFPPNKLSRGYNFNSGIYLFSYFSVCSITENTSEIERYPKTVLLFIDFYEAKPNIKDRGNVCEGGGCRPKAQLINVVNISKGYKRKKNTNSNLVYSWFYGRKKNNLKNRTLIFDLECNSRVKYLVASG